MFRADFGTWRRPESKSGDLEKRLIKSQALREIAGSIPAVLARLNPGARLGQDLALWPSLLRWPCPLRPLLGVAVRLRLSLSMAAPKLLRADYAAPDMAVDCRECGGRYAALLTHVRMSHRMSRQQYQDRWPDAPLRADNLTLIRRELVRDQAGEPYWTKQRVIRAIQRFYEHHGRVPSRNDFCAPRSRAAKGLFAQGYKRHEFPSDSTAVALFGSWTAAVSAAGFSPRLRGGNWRRPRKRCHRGHVLTEENVYVERTAPVDLYPDGKRICAICHRARQAEYRRRKLAHDAHGVGR